MAIEQPFSKRNRLGIWGEVQELMYGCDWF
jgi:hypothetical protein